MFEFGARWLRIDFHLHTEQDKEFVYKGDNFHTDYVDKLNKEGIRIGMITNHNKFNKHEFKELKKSAIKKDVFLMPGVELTIKEGHNGLHTLIVFKEEEWLENGNDDINNFLNQVFTGIPNRESENIRCNLDLINTINKLDEFNKDYFIVFAHIEHDSGFIKELGGGLIKSLAQKPEFKKNVYGFQKLRTRDNIKKLKDWMGFELAFVEGSDPKCIDQIGKGNECFMKLGTFTFDAVRLALRDYESRITTEFKPIQHSYIKSISFNGGKLNNKVVKLSHELNTLIGVRGSGKSSILEMLRYGLNLDVGVDKIYKEGLEHNTLGSGGTLILDVIDKYGRSYKIKRILNEAPSIIDETGKDINISINSIINNPLYFGQKDLSKTEDGYEINLLDKLLGDSIDEFKVKIQSKEDQLIIEINNWRGLDNLNANIKDLEDKNSDLEHKLIVFQEKGVAEKLNKQTSFGKDMIQIEKVETEISHINNKLIEIVNEDVINDLGKIQKYTTNYNEEIFNYSDKYVEQYVLFLKGIIDNTESAESIIKQISELKNQLLEKTVSLKDEFAEIKREINEPNLKIDNFITFSELIEVNNNQILELKKKKPEDGVYEANIKRYIRERNELLVEEFNNYKDEIVKINTSQDQLNIDITLKGNKEVFKTLLKTRFSKSGVTESKYERMSEKFTDFVGIFEDVYFNNGKELKKIITEKEYELIQAKFEQNMSDIIKTKVPNKININYHGKQLNLHSLGQRASALMLFILTQEDNDLIIIDQPEDDLDNKVIYKELINAIKAKKTKIQFIFVTHNANIPVLGDAEQIIATNYNDNEINFDYGCIDVPDMQTRVVDIMEGGPEAFERRNNIYKLWKIEDK